MIDHLRDCRRPALLSFLLLAACATGCGSVGSATSNNGPTNDPTWTTERQRELARIDKGPAVLKTFDVMGVRFSWWFDDLSDAIGGTPSRLARDMADKENPDTRREGMMELVSRPYGEGQPYTQAYAEICSDTSQDPLVRATALRSLNRSRWKQYTPLYITQLGDSNELVRLEACKALNRMPDVNAVPQLLKMVVRIEEDKDIRIAATEALRHYKRLDVARALAGLLNERDFGIAWQAHRSLRDITHKNFGYDEATWLNYLTGPDKPLG